MNLVQKSTLPRITRIQGKFASKWQPRYTLYSKSSWIVYVMIALLIVDQKILTNKKRNIIKSLATSLKFE